MSAKTEKHIFKPEIGRGYEILADRYLHGYKDEYK